MDHTPSALSGGQQQRVAIARALVTDPPLLLADEPTGNLDTRTSLEVLALLQRLNRDRGITIALVTHEHDIAECASRVITFRDGRMVSDVRQHTPMDAAKVLADLPAADLRESPKGDEATLGASAHGGPLGGPVPFVVYLGMFFGTLLGTLVGNLYTALVVGAAIRWVPPLFAVLTEALLASWVARRRLHRNLTSDQRVRVALTYTLVMTTVQALVVMLAMSSLPAPMLAGLDRLAGSPLVAILVVFLLLAALTLLRYLLLSLTSVFAPAPPRVRA
jgi:putative ABC transport system ATP-binding protein